MNKYRKKPIIIEAFQMTLERRKDNSEWPEWLNEAWNKNNNLESSLFPKDFPDSNGTDLLSIYTLEGIQTVNWNDYIIQGVNKEIYPCKPDIFEKTYEKV